MLGGGGSSCNQKVVDWKPNECYCPVVLYWTSAYAYTCFDFDMRQIEEKFKGFN